ncbi:MAG: protein-S-isoprenylcysteine O-methyltransferase [Armatimonadota bacterium]
MSELPYKITTGLLLSVYALIRAWYQRGQPQLPKVVIRDVRRESIMYNIVAIATVPMFLYIFTPWIDGFHIPIPVWARWTGAFIMLMGEYLFYLTHKALGKNWSPVLEIRRGHTLITDGPYKYVRHPMYLAFYVIGIELLALTANWVVSVVYLSAVTLMYSLRVSSEEQMMVDQFGDEYREYMQHTGRLLPRL